MRSFLGLGTDQAFQAQLVPQMAALQQQPWAQPLRWVAPHNWHVTMIFLGEQAAGWLQALLPEIQQALSERFLKEEALLLLANRIGCFPKPGSSVLALEFNYPPWLQVLKACLDKVVLLQGFTPEARALRPHLTLARTKQSQALQLDDWNVDLALRVFSVALYSSRPTPKGSEYTVLWQVPLLAGV